MKSMIIVALALVAVAAAVPVEVAPVQILKSNFDQQPDGTYNFGFDSENGISRQEEGTVKQVLDEENKPHDVVVVRGSYSYVNADGTPENIVYYADETGYHAEGSSVPKPPARR